MKRLTLSVSFVILCFIPVLLKAAVSKVIQQQTPTWIAQIPKYPDKKRLTDTISGFILNVSEEQIHLEKKTRYTRLIREIVSHEGVKDASEFSLSFNPSYQTLALHKLILWRNGVAFDKLDLKKIDIEADETDHLHRKYSNQHTAYISLEDLKKGDKLELAYSIQGANPVFEDHIFRFIYLQSYTPEDVSYKSVICSNKRSLKFDYLNSARKPERKVEGDLIRYEWHRRNQKALIFEEDEPDWFYPGPIVQISDYSNWSKVASMAQKLIPVHPVRDHRLKALSQELMKGETSKASLFRKTVRYVQNKIESISVPDGLFLPEVSKPERTLSQRYGDSRDKAVLLATLLRSLGINAWIALVNDNDHLNADQYLPSLSIFERAVVKASINGKEVWVDPSLTHQGGREAEVYFPGAENVLVLNGQSNKLVRVPHSRHGKIKSVERYTLNNTTNPVNLEVTSIYTLNEADRMRKSLANTPLDTVQKNYLNYYSTRYPYIKVKDKIIIRDDDQKNVLTLIEHYKIDRFFSKDSVLKNYNCSFGADLISNKLVNTKADRNNPIQVEFPTDIDLTIEAFSTGGWNIDIENREIKRDAFIFRSNIYPEDDLLTLHYTFRYLKPYIPINNVSEYAADIDAMKEEYLDYYVVHTPDEVPYIPNYWMIGFSVFVTLLCILLAFHIYTRRSADKGQNRATIKLGGTLIFISISLLVTAGSLAYDIVDGEFTDLNIWKAFQSRKSFWLYKTLLIVSTFRDIFICCFSIFCVILILKKRNILPKLIVFYFAASSILLVLIFVLDFLLYHQGDFMRDVGYSIFMTLICIAYFQNSERVKQTFVVPYMKKDAGSDNSNSSIN